MEKKKAYFICIAGMQYYEKKIEYEEWSDSVEIIGVTNIRYNAMNVSSFLEMAMRQDVVQKIDQTLKRNPFHINRKVFDSSNDTKEMVIVGRDTLLVKRGCFGETSRNNKVERYINRHRDTLNFYDIESCDSYEVLIQLYEQMMKGEIDQSLLTKACMVVPNDVYLEILSVLNGFAGTNSLDKYYEKSKEKIKILLEHYQ